MANDDADARNPADNLERARREVEREERLGNDIERAVNGLNTIKQLSIICDPDDEHYINAIRDLAQLHGKRLDDALARLRDAPATGIFDADDD